MRKFEVKPYNEQWFSMFEDEANELHEIFGPEIIEIHHIGSTSVNGLKAKPIIDIMPVVRDINRIDEFNTAMVTCGIFPKSITKDCLCNYLLSFLVPVPLGLT